jgi:hypothetical protein
MSDLPIWVFRYGSEKPPPERIPLHAGPFTALLEAGTLRWIKLGAEEVVRGIYIAVRDRNWATIEPHLLRYEVDAQESSFRVELSAEHASPDVDFAWQGTIIGTSEGVITFTFQGTARRSFLKNRIGFCVLHPTELAGQPVKVKTPSGAVNGIFPQRISPHQPFENILALSYSASSNASIELRFEGELFEMEDQRNWTDASYKTYCTPLHLPYPVEIHVGEHVSQTITLLAHITEKASQSSPQIQPLLVRMTTKTVGTLPALGLGFASRRASLTEIELKYLQDLQPAHLWVELDITKSAWEKLLLQANQQAALLSTQLELSVLCDTAGGRLEELESLLASENIPVARLFLFPRSGMVTTQSLVSKAKSLSGAGRAFLIGGGSRANFAEFNRAYLPLDDIEIAGYPINPQVHAFDNSSLVETLTAQATTVESASAIVGNLPLSVGPITLKPRFNAAATSTQSQEDENAASIDPRQMSLFTAGWTIGSMKYLALARVKWLTYHETIGERGLLKFNNNEEDTLPFPFPSNACFPVYHVFADLAVFAQADLLSCEVSDSSTIGALALSKNEQILLLVANLTNATQSVTLQLPEAITGQLRILDETTAEQAMFDAQTFRHAVHRDLNGQTREIQLTLLPYATARILRSGPSMPTRD